MSQTESLEPIRCRCGGMPTAPQKVPNCNDRWIIQCQVERCYAKNIGQSRAAVIEGWNRLSSSFYR